MYKLLERRDQRGKSKLSPYFLKVFTLTVAEEDEFAGYISKAIKVLRKLSSGLGERGSLRLHLSPYRRAEATPSK